MDTALPRADDAKEKAGLGAIFLIVFLIRKSRGGSLDDPYGRRGHGPGAYGPRRGRGLFS